MSKNLITKEYEFEQLRKCYKRYEGRTFNQFIMGAGSKAIYKWFDQAGAHGIDGLLTIVPAVMKPFTFDIKKLDMANYTSGSTFQFKLRKDIEWAMQDTTEGFMKYFGMHRLIYTVLMLNLFMVLPPFFGKLAYRTF